MNMSKVLVLMLLGIDLLSSKTDGMKQCSCYTFNNNTIKKTWPQAWNFCRKNNKTLVVMETEQEWEFINNMIQNQSGSYKGEWFIGLEKHFSTGNWTWINGEPLTIDKWQKRNPENTDSFALMHREYPDGTKGSFSSFSCINRGWICEEHTDDCKGTCFFRFVPTSTSLQEITLPTTQTKTLTENDLRSWTTMMSVVTVFDDFQCYNNGHSYCYLIIVILAGLLFAVLIVLSLVLALLRKKQKGKDPNNEAVQRKEGARLEEPFPWNHEYADLCPQTMMVPPGNGSREYTSLFKSTNQEKNNDYVNQIPTPDYVNA